MNETLFGATPTWLQQASRLYTERLISQNDFTTMERAFAGADILEQAVKRIHVASIAVIGIGFENERLQQCVIPPVLAARLSNLGKNNFHMALIDINQNTDTIVRKKAIYAIPLTPEQQRYWQQYLDETKQQDRLVSRREKELVFISKKDVRFLEEKKVRAAETPMIYQSKLANGDISIVRANVAQGEWAKNTSLDYIDCRSVLMHLSKEGQQLALWHISQSLRREGILVINDRSPNSLNVLLKENGGWLDANSMKDLGLINVTKKFQLPSGNNIHILQKTLGIATVYGVGVGVDAV